MFRPVMVEPSPEYLEATWKYVFLMLFAILSEIID